VKALLKEPLLHFLLIGAAVFGVYAWLHRDARDSGALHRVRIDEGDVKWLAEAWTRQWQREPTRDELRGLVTEYLREEVLAREARALGLDDNDTIVRRRLAQKLEFLVQDTARVAEPSDDDLRRFYVANPDRFMTAARVSFAQVYFSREQRRDAAADATTALAALPANASPERAAAMGDRLFIDAEFRDVDEQTVAAQFGHSFTRAVFALVPGEWHGPVESGYGLHLVRVSAQQPPRLREFAEARAQVLERWREQQERHSEEQYFATLLKKYYVHVDDTVKPLLGPLNGPLPEPPITNGEERMG
jgi:parvulin-like peptidyl-prolyl cis-trans isomerase-like protein